MDKSKEDAKDKMTVFFVGGCDKGHGKEREGQRSTPFPKRGSG